jgi:uncharacterized membrane protein YfcA
MGGLDASDLVLFIGATFAASFVAGFAGFAFGIVAAAVWLHFLNAGQSAALIVAFGLMVQGMAVWKLRQAVKLGRLAPFLIGGATGLAGIAATVWCSLRGWPPAEQRAVFQPVGVSVFVMAALWFGSSGTLGADALGLFLIGLPALAAGTWAGITLFGRLDESGFRRVVLVLLLVSGVSLLVTGR